MGNKTAPSHFFEALAVMTAEIAILNKHAVALAADSAVTIGRNLKTYNSANKLFMLSKYEPIGAMIYGGAEFMGIPWETIFKDYRLRLECNRFDTVDEYCQDFRAFLADESSLFGEKRKEFTLAALVRMYLRGLLKKVHDQVRTELNSGSSKELEPLALQVMKNVIETAVGELSRVDDLPESRSDSLRKSLQDSEQTIENAIAEEFENFPLADELRTLLQQLIREVICKDTWSDHYSGVVIAGFGAKEFFPRLHALRIETVIKDQLKYKEDHAVTIADESDAAIIPFAQSDMVKSFVGGVDPSYAEVATGYLDTLFEGLPGKIVSVLQSGKDGNSVLDGGKESELRSLTTALLQEFKQKISNFQQENYIQATLEVVGFLPVDELAAMAETLVSLTSFKRRMSMAAETVGGPVDVAVISKGDGFIWIKRKHYFKPELNHGFFTNYFRATSGFSRDE